MPSSRKYSRLHLAENDCPDALRYPFLASTLAVWTDQKKVFNAANKYLTRDEIQHVQHRFPVVYLAIVVVILACYTMFALGSVQVADRISKIDSHIEGYTTVAKRYTNGMTVALEAHGFLLQGYLVQANTSVSAFVQAVDDLQITLSGQMNDVLDVVAAARASGETKAGATIDNLINSVNATIRRKLSRDVFSKIDIFITELHILKARFDPWLTWFSEMYTDAALKMLRPILDLIDILIMLSDMIHELDWTQMLGSRLLGAIQTEDVQNRVKQFDAWKEHLHHMVEQVTEFDDLCRRICSQIWLRFQMAEAVWNSTKATLDTDSLHLTYVADKALHIPRTSGDHMADAFTSDIQNQMPTLIRMRGLALQIMEFLGRASRLVQRFTVSVTGAFDQAVHVFHNATDKRHAALSLTLERTSWMWRRGAIILCTCFSIATIATFSFTLCMVRKGPEIAVSTDEQGCFKYCRSYILMWIVLGLFVYGSTMVALFICIAYGPIFGISRSTASLCTFKALQIFSDGEKCMEVLRIIASVVGDSILQSDSSCKDSRLLICSNCVHPLYESLQLPYYSLIVAALLAFVQPAFVHSIIQASYLDIFDKVVLKIEKDQKDNQSIGHIGSLEVPEEVLF